ncbi:MAG: hypothetical protein ACXWEY_04755 [Bacteroidia bacterium]
MDIFKYYNHSQKTPHRNAINEEKLNSNISKGNFVKSTSDENAPWGISLMQVGIKASLYKTAAEENGNFDQSNYSLGPNGRLQFSLLDFFAYGDQKFRIVDVFGFEAGLGYQKSKTYRNDQYYYGEFITKKMWYDAGVDLGILFKYRVVPELDLGIKYVYISQVNSTFNFTNSHSAMAML